MKTLSEKECGAFGCETFRKEDVKEFIKNVNKRIENQMRIHWKWLKTQDSKEISKYIQTIINNQDTSVSGNTYYNITAYRAFVEAIDNLGGLVGIQIVIDDALAIQIDVDNLTLDINTAMNGLVLYDTYNLALNNLLQARSLNISIYTLDSQTRYLS